MNMRDYFSSDVIFTGKHAEFLDDLWKQNDIRNSYIKTLYEIYLLSSVLGLRKNLKAKSDRSTNSKRSILAGQIYNCRKELLVIMKTILLLDESENLSEDDRVTRAFKGPFTDKEFNDNVDLFNDYARGGIEYLHEMLIERDKILDNEDYSDYRVENIMNMLNVLDKEDELEI